LVDRPKACHVILLLPLNSRISRRTNNCTQFPSVIRALKQIHTNFRKSKSDRIYPIIIFHNDATRAQQQSIETLSGVQGPIMWYKLNFNELTLPSYLRESGIIKFYTKYHNDPFKYAAQFPKPVYNLTLSDPRSHGWGYAMMCRLFAGLIFFSRPMEKFQYYWRIDAGDSALNDVDVDPFVYMQTNNKGYGYSPLYGEGKGCPWTELQLPQRHLHFIQRNPKHVHLQVECRRMPRHAYNNFEVVDMTLFRNDSFLDYFVDYDKSGAFFCGYKLGKASDCSIEEDFRLDSKPGKGYAIIGNRVLGDAEFRGQALSIFAGDRPAVKLPGIKYAHPVAWATCSKSEY